MIASYVLALLSEDLDIQRGFKKQKLEEILLTGLLFFVSTTETEKPNILRRQRTIELYSE